MTFLCACTVFPVSYPGIACTRMQCNRTRELVRTHPFSGLYTRENMRATPSSGHSLPCGVQTRPQVKVAESFVAPFASASDTLAGL